MKKICFLFLQLFAVSFAFGQFTISGKVLDETNQPLVSATILVENTFAGTYSNQKGEFVLKNLKKGEYSIKVLFIGYATIIKNVKLEKDESIEFIMKHSSIVADEIIVQATRVADKTPTTYSTINKEAIAKNNSGQDIPYLLSLTPSMVVSSDAGTGIGYTTINIRGSDVKRINVTVNGIPLNDAESHGVWWVDLPDIASSVENTQIQRGVGTSTNGAGAFGATINMQTFTLNREPYAEVSSSYGSFNTSKNTINVGTGLINKKFAVDARLSKLWSDGYVDRAFSDLKSFYVSGTMYGKSSILKFVTFSGQEHTYQAWYGVPKDSLKTNRTYNPYDYKNQTDNYWQDNYQLHYSKEINSNLNLNVALHYTRGKGYYENSEPGNSFDSYNLPNAIFGTDTITSTDFINQKWLKNDFYGLTYSLNYKKKRLNTVLGGGWNQYKGDHYGDIIWAKIVTFSGEKYRWYKGTGDKKDLNVFLKTNYLITGNLSLYADLQLRNIDYSIAGFDDNLKDVTQHNAYTFFNPKAGLFYEFNEKQNVYVSFGVAQREPDRGNFVDADSGKIPKPEKLYDLEAGYEFRNAKFMFRGNIFHMKYIDQLIMTGEINNVGAGVMTNVKDSYREGIELEAGYKILKNLQWNANLMLSKNIIPEYTEYVDNWDTWGQDSTVLKNMTISFSPSVIFNNVLQYQPVKNFTIEFASKYVGKQYTDNTTNNKFMSTAFHDSIYTDNRVIDAYFVNNLSLSYSISGKLFKEIQFQFTINNLFNEKYETNAWVYSYISNNKYSDMNGYFPQATRNFMGRVVFKF
ncbi:MAG: TonB-dependent receptor [Bacteroidia bacterium]|nr:TonB-dependent receptor [Bacteroidia bacterium]